MAVIIEKLDHNGQTLVIELIGYTEYALKHKLIKNTQLYNDTLSILSLHICELVAADFDKWNKMPISHKRVKCKYLVINALQGRYEPTTDILHHKHAKRKVLTSTPLPRSRQIIDDYKSVGNRFPCPYTVAAIKDEYAHGLVK